MELASPGGKLSLVAAGTTSAGKTFVSGALNHNIIGSKNHYFGGGAMNSMMHYH